MTTVLIVDDHPLVRGALMQQITSLLPMANVIAAGSADQARTAARQAAKLDLVLLDFNLPDSDGLALLNEWRTTLPGVPVIVVTGESHVAQAVQDAGAAAFVPKSASESTLRDAIAQALRIPGADGATRTALDMLTPRQQEVLRALVAGKSNLDIANHLDISEPTVKVHLTAIFKLLGVVSRTQAVLSARAAGW
ncbi:MAG TPA: response regulator transcription factor [Noviherbaspirillum sp.]|jgi:DNA-binding NarL/FixJ family response regulator|uniref:response regulator transcription factor n=1 Tax=Noviherbaspirillum sp. TaxID=1926288 RepID=UPI002DDCB198|nr:response regulator transcription factor [Noviherbaspirillum sp.]HEV2612304.1 response regulator transcription factor [Noviherbaspirillum sp.]